MGLIQDVMEHRQSSSRYQINTKMFSKNLIIGNKCYDDKKNYICFYY